MYIFKAMFTFSTKPFRLAFRLAFRLVESLVESYRGISLMLLMLLLLLLLLFSRKQVERFILQRAITTCFRLGFQLVERQVEWQVERV